MVFAICPPLCTSNLVWLVQDQDARRFWKNCLPKKRHVGKRVSRWIWVRTVAAEHKWSNKTRTRTLKLVGIRSVHSRALAHRPKRSRFKMHNGFCSSVASFHLFHYPFIVALCSVIISVAPSILILICASFSGHCALLVSLQMRRGSVCIRVVYTRRPFPKPAVICLSGFAIFSQGWKRENE